MSPVHPRSHPDTHLQREVQPRGLLDLQLDVILYGRPKTWLLDSNE